MAGRVTFADLLRKAESKDRAEKPSVEVVPVITTNASTATKLTLPTQVTSPTPLTAPTSPTKKPIAPERDFSKVANSIIREAMPLFIGKSKQIYDFLYSITRGAVIPKRSIRVTKAKLMDGASIGSERTLLKNLSHLKLVGLLRISEYEGQHQGNEYEIYLPEEITAPTPPTLPHPHHSPNAPSKVGTVRTAEGDERGVGNLIENKADTGLLRLSFKDNTKNDDEAFADFIEIFQAAAVSLTGRELTRGDADKLKELSELLVLELKIAASRTEGISSVPAFLTEVLRRQFFPSRKQKILPTKSSKIKIDAVGKAEQNSYEIKALDEASRKVALAELREFANDDFLKDFKKWYTEEDWNWLVFELEKDGANEKLDL